jgi:dephospho-CoA kinase
MLAEKGIATVDADEVGHDVLGRDGPAFDEVASRWPEVVVEGVIDRSALAAIVFGERDELEALESITHPHIFDTIRARVERLQPPVVVEIPLLREGLGGEWHRLVVDSRDDVKLARAVERGLGESDARARLNAQPSRSAWLAAADLVIPNHGSVDELRIVVDSAAGHL